MMISVVTWQLLAVMLAAALLGLLIGLSGMRLYHARRQKKAYHSHRAAIDKLTAQCDDLNAEKVSIMQALESEKKLGALSRGKHTQLVAQQEALQVHSGLQGQKLSKLSAELHAAEEKNIRLERDFASFKANKLREVRMLKVNSDEWLDNEELPVLNKKVAQTHTGSTAVDHDYANTHSSASDDIDPDQTQPIIASELDIPSLSESELPDSVEELEFELVDLEEVDESK